MPNTQSRFHLSVVATGMTISVFFAVSYVFCVIYGLLIAGPGFHQSFSSLLPGFIWLNWVSFFIGLFWSAAVGWYVAIIFVPLSNYFNQRFR